MCICVCMHGFKREGRGESDSLFFFCNEITNIVKLDVIRVGYVGQIDGPTYRLSSPNSIKITTGPAQSSD